ncbi:maltose alpha-D-glucosyltransferase/alpha-amylase [Phyllobacterium ifriqiyense]|uniref:maltose alpha-D-glucosyltransferase n=1 Tax=Phyllobacterium ifriqiyense TaxID=314238 RepID=A0ABU0S3A6_9HYPH|nr:maltose alpha-D-glucosyltransferase [Phyllobacterium ifriqiyense]MDQ0995204.1 maltose alpha-D-glucosyltransferase/alpha-amylase [Phyllobacterium ifriqiyense]
MDVSVNANAPAGSKSPDWYKDAIIYQVHVKAFQDSNDDGIGDFAGLIRRLDHIETLGVNTIWLLPFYPSPLRDDGYDISDYRAINPSYGDMRSFRRFVTEAHARGLRVVTELVINHTSDQHPWFQRARRARVGSNARDFYVWSDTDAKFPETRIIFTDTEKSNWTWDEVAGAYFWHRFYSHQPDLNFDNPNVFKEVIKAMHHWLEIGVDGLRLDAIPYLVEREGTNNENLPETHDVLRRIRAELDAHYDDRMLLAEANQWPEDTRPYFGEGDECHMGFHFPIMPRMYMAVAQEDRHPLTDIIRQTPDIPENCQWAIFLRNHDELTLEMVTQEERDYLWQTYAEDSRARINLGIRRRLAPLMQNDRRKIELMNSLLLSLPGSPVLYYGDEIGMGDNYYLGDRDGVRTPMQWSSDRNGGFSRADPQRLFLPAISDPIYGYQVINVETQNRDTSSLLNWMRRMMAVRKEHLSFGRGTMTLLYPLNRRIFAYLRQHGNETILCVANLSRTAEAVELELAAWKGCVPIELNGRSTFPPIGDLPYLLTLAPYGFYWFRLAQEFDAPAWHRKMPEILPEFVTLAVRDGRAASVLSGREKTQLEQDVLPKFLPLQRWFSHKGQNIERIETRNLIEIAGGDCAWALVDIQIAGQVHTYSLPVSAKWGEANLAFGSPKLSYTMAKIRRGSTVGSLIDAAYDEKFAAELISRLQNADEARSEDGLIFHASDRLKQLDELQPPRVLTADQSNVSVAFGDKLILKLYRQLRPGVQPDVEIAQALTERTGFKNTPAYLGHIEVAEPNGQPATLVVVSVFVSNQGNAWDAIVSALKRSAGEIFTASGAGSFSGTIAEQLPVNIAEVLGQRTAELHRALSGISEVPAFQIEPMTTNYLKGVVDNTMEDLDRLYARLNNVPMVSALEDVQKILAAREPLTRLIESLSDLGPSGGLSRIHGDYHLGQVLIVENDLAIIDFEGEPRRPLDQRRHKSSPLVDVAGMLRSFDYAAETAIAESLKAAGADAAVNAIYAWQKDAVAAFMTSYNRHMAGCSTYSQPNGFSRHLLQVLQIQKAAYEIIYELDNRPQWVGIPLRGLAKLLEAKF